MSEKDINLVTDNASSVITEFHRVAYGIPASSITPSTVTAMVGIAKGEALDLAPKVKSAMSALSAKAASLDFPANVQAASALANLTSLQSDLGVTGTAGTSNLGNFGQILSRAQSHIQTGIEIKNVEKFVANTSFSDFGSGITNMSTMATRGLDSVMGNLPSAANALEIAGPCFDLGNPATIGTGAGFVEKLRSAKLGNFTGLNQQLAANGVDLDRLDDPVYSDSISKTLSNIKDPETISAVSAQLSINPANKLTSLSDFTDLSKLAPPSATTGLTGGLSGIASKFKDLGASFPSPAAAAGLLRNIEIPNIPNLNSAVPNLSSHMASLSPDIKSLTGSGVGASLLNGADGLPNITDFTHAVSGGPEIEKLANLGTSMSLSDISALEDSITKTRNLLGTAGVDLPSLPGTNLSSSMGFATNLHKFGASADTGIADTLKTMARSGSQWGDSIKASLAEGKNKALMASAGIKPPNFGESPFKNFPYAASDNTVSGTNAIPGYQG